MLSETRLPSELKHCSRDPYATPWSPEETTNVTPVRLIWLIVERFSGHANERTVTASALHLANLIAYPLKSTCIVIEDSVNSCVI